MDMKQIQRDTNSAKKKLKLKQNKQKKAQNEYY